ncbi:hypothetical protein GCM10009733_051650 [Nonomuraea maheshkhaliensis]|uniref:OmpA-like domain-containing protein n=1 Tax=Nonomuraea maheshkhaliensis TaxID=419590 RepID=A0ABN2FIK1_9ACTN
MSDALRTRLALDRARTAARTGDLDAALALLDSLDSTAGEDVGAVLDLRARVHAQRGELDAADRCWAAVQELAPDDPAAAEGRRTIARITAGRRRTRPLVHPGRLAVAAAGVTAVVLTGGAVVALGSSGAGSSASSVRADAPGGRAAALEAERAALGRERAAVAAERAAVERERAEVAAAEERRTAAAARLDARLAAITGRVSMPGLTVRRRSRDVQVRFDTGLFRQSADVSPRGRALLRALGRRMAGMDVRITVVGHAVPVPGGRTRGGSVVALGRALVAARHLAEGGGLPRTSFTLVSADQSDNPHRQATRNRTVTLRITPQG